jgi:hypothetical protein
MATKLNNRHVYPDANHQPRHLARLRRESAVERQAAYDQLTIQQKLEALDRQFGVGLGAQKQRARLIALSNKQNQPEKSDDKKGN